MEHRPVLDVDPLDPEILCSFNAAAAATGPQNGNGSQQPDVLAQAQPTTAAALPAGISTNGSSTIATSTAAAAEKAPCDFITQEMLGGIKQCLISQADECGRKSLPAHQAEKIIVEKLGRCMVEIVDSAIRSMLVSRKNN